MNDAGAPLSVRVEPLMGTVFSIHLRGPGAKGEAATEAVEGCLTELKQLERLFSPFLRDSDILRMRRGELLLADADPRVREVESACRALEAQTAGRFSAWWRGWFDPTGFVKGWATEVATAHHLTPLLDDAGIVAFGVVAGGDVRVRTRPDADGSWPIGIADPWHPGRVIATVDLRNGAVATSGTAERGAHIVDPRTGRVVTGTVSAKVIADDLTTADVWATTALVAGIDDLSWITHAPACSGLVLGEDGAARRWLDGIEVSVSEAQSPFLTV